MVWKYFGKVDLENWKPAKSAGRDLCVAEAKHNVVVKRKGAFIVHLKQVLKK